MSTPVPGDAVAISPTPDKNGFVAGVGDAGRLLSYSQDEHGHPMASYHSASSRKTASTPAAALSRLTEGEGVDESKHPDLKIVPLAIGDQKHVGRSVIFHQGKAVGTLDPGKIQNTKIHTVSSGEMGADKHFLDRGKALDAIHAHFTGATYKLKKKSDALTIGDLLKLDFVESEHPRAANGEFGSGGGGSKPAEGKPAQKKIERNWPETPRKFKALPASHTSHLEADGDALGSAIPNCPPNRAKNLAALRDAILTKCGGHGVLISQDTKDPDNAMIMREGEYRDGKGATLVKGLVGPDRCHENSAELYMKDPEHSTLVEGYAANTAGVWVRHSWVERDGQITETTSPRVSYFGAKMTKPQTELYLALRGKGPRANELQTLTARDYQDEMRARADGPGTDLAKLESAAPVAA
jgi:hypothetical protein